jgi:hypothetical protein
MLRVLPLLLLTAPALAEPLVDPLADRALDCAVLSAVAGDVAAVRRALTAAMAAEMAASGEFAERAVPRVQAEFALRADAARGLDAGELDARMRSTCPRPS